MKISVVIPAYNAEATIRTTLNSVLSQTVAPYEILVFDDGSTDNTALILESYKPHVTVFRQSNQGVAHARNYLCERARGDIIAFLDADDIWHPNYLEVQSNLFKEYTNAVAFFTGHVTFSGYGNYQWDIKTLDFHPITELITPLSFFERYNEAPGLFYPSYCCVRKRVLKEIGSEPFGPNLIRAEDFFFFNLIAPLGSIVYTSSPLVAYRITERALSENRLKLYGSVVHAFDLLEDRYRKLTDVKFRRAFKMYFSSNRRYYAKILMGAGQTSEARRQFLYSLSNAQNPLSIVKSLTWLSMSYMPSLLQPKWYSSHREVKSLDHTSTADELKHKNVKISVVIPAYNAEATIRTTLNSVLSQTVAPYEILVFDDGSTDNTALILESYKPHVTVFRQSNQGVAHARNYLCERAQGDIIAFLDADDIWHPNYLEVQSNLFATYSNAIAFFVGHVNFYGHGPYIWNHNPIYLQPAEIIDPLSFFERYNKTTGHFASMSYCCIPKRVLLEIGNEPFRFSGAEDSYLCNLLPLFGSVVYTPIPFVAYRITDQSLSVNHLNTFSLWVNVFEFQEERFSKQSDARLSRAFKMAFASKRRYYAKLLMGAGDSKEARRQLRSSLRNTRNLTSITKSLGLLFLSYMPAPLHPKWPPSYRLSKSHDHASVKDEPW